MRSFWPVLLLIRGAGQWDHRVHQHAQIVSSATKGHLFSSVMLSKGSRVAQGTRENDNESGLGYVHTVLDRLTLLCEKLTVTTCTAASNDTSNIEPARLAERVWYTKLQSSLLNIYFRLSRFQSSLLLIYFRDGPNRCSYYTKVWHRTYPICDVPLSRSARRSFAPSQKSRLHNRYFVWKQKPYPV